MLATRSQVPKSAKFLETDVKRKSFSAARACPRKLPNKELRAREYLTTHEVEALRKAARSVGRQGHRDDTLVLMMFRHALRVSEAVSLRWEQVDLSLGLLHVR